MYPVLLTSHTKISDVILQCGQEHRNGASQKTNSMLIYNCVDSVELKFFQLLGVGCKAGGISWHARQGLDKVCMDYCAPRRGLMEGAEVF